MQESTTMERNVYSGENGGFFQDDNQDVTSLWLLDPISVDEKDRLLPRPAKGQGVSPRNYKTRGLDSYIL